MLTFQKSPVIFNNVRVCHLEINKQHINFQHVIILSKYSSLVICIEPSACSLMIVSSEMIFSTLLSLDFLSLPNAGLCRFTSFNARMFWPLCFWTCHQTNKFEVNLKRKDAKHHNQLQIWSLLIMFPVTDVYLKDTSKGPGAQMVQHRVATDHSERRSVLVHCLNAFSQIVQFLFLHWKHKNFVCLSVYLIYFTPQQSMFFLFSPTPKQLNKQINSFRSYFLQCRVKLWFAGPHRQRGPAHNVQHQ